MYHNVFRRWIRDQPRTGPLMSNYQRVDETSAYFPTGAPDLTESPGQLWSGNALAAGETRKVPGKFGKQAMVYQETCLNMLGEIHL